MSKYTNPVTFETLETIAPEMADLIVDDLHFLNTVQYAGSRSSMDDLREADQAVRSGVELSDELFQADLESAVNYVQSPEYQEYLARYGAVLVGLSS